VLASGAWDNVHRPDEFLDWVARVGECTHLANSPAVLRWNLDKHYLAALADAGVVTVPTAWLTPGPAHEPDLHELPGSSLPEGEFVIKPTVSGGGFETARYRTTDGESAVGGGGGDARAHIRRLLNAGRAVMIQPYQESVDTAGETGLIFLGGRYSHAIAKGALLQIDAGPQTHLYQREQIGPLTPSELQLETAQHALTTAEHLVGPTTYARVDLVALDDGTPAVLELELLDPALFFETAPAAAVSRYAQVLRDLIH
jgi:glutathione synthase/RimK-type ligase-like ATP-grasp enzyme